MLGPLVKAQLVAFLTKKVSAVAGPSAWRCLLTRRRFRFRQLLESPAFVGGVHALHGSVTRIQQGAYDALLQATGERPRHGGSRTPLVVTATCADPRLHLPRHSTLCTLFAEEYDRKDPSHHLKDQATATTHWPRREETPKQQNEELLAFIERTRRELEKEQGKR